MTRWANNGPEHLQQVVSGTIPSFGNTPSPPSARSQHNLEAGQLFDAGQQFGAD
jgi:hypothetical protein